ncbi:efflux RND transporter periplasmic adaptor subunit, partial [Marinomonas sp. 2405UD68-3]|uniref:efflux RND transporter periplasmic adaptor subunit n=1 Tax=Marinomonas sp. 2405UD68-3 TaxID=3391835 RepID=UPI0039C958A1
GAFAQSNYCIKGFGCSQSLGLTLPEPSLNNNYFVGLLSIQAHQQTNRKLMNTHKFGDKYCMKRFSQWIVLAIMIFVLAGVYFFITNAIDAKNKRTSKPRPPAKEQVLDVSVITVFAEKHAATLTAFGTAEPRFQLNLTSKVSGDLIDLNPLFETGKQVKNESTLATLHNYELLSQFDQAKSQIAKARLSFEEEVRQVEQAKAEWKAAGFIGEPDSDLVLRKPQLEVTKATLIEAKSALKKAQDDVNHLTVRAPFDALIVTRDVSLGSQVQSGTKLGTLYSTDRIEITLPLTPKDWTKLPAPEEMIQNKWPIAITSINETTLGKKEVWQGYVLRAANHIDTTTKMRSLVVAVDDPFSLKPILLPGSFVQATLFGKPLNDLWRLPSSALSQKSDIWYVDSDNRLKAFPSTPIFMDKDSVYIQAPNELKNTPQKVLIRPYNSYIQGALVNPIESTSNKNMHIKKAPMDQSNTKAAQP